MAAKTHKHVHSDEPVKPIAKSDDGSVQITLTIPWGDVLKEMENVAQEMGKEATVPGFRKGKAPLDRLLSHFSKDTLIEKSLYKLLPKLFAKTIEENNIAPIMYPKFEIISAQEGEDWQVRAITCEMPEVKLGDYKSAIKNALSSSAIWTPEKGTDEKKPPTKEEKEQVALRTLVESSEVTIPNVLVEEEVNARLSSLLERIEKLGLGLENYLGSIKKTPDSLREEYTAQAKESLKLDIILTKVSQAEGISIDEKEMEAFLAVTAADPNLQQKFSTPEQKETIRSILKKRKVIDSLTSLA